MLKNLKKKLNFFMARKKQSKISVELTRSITISFISMKILNFFMAKKMYTDN